MAGLVLLAAVIGCRRIDPPAPPLTGEELWRQAVCALADGQSGGAAELFRRSLDADDDVDRRRDAVVRLFAAGEAEAARALLAGRSAPSLVAAMGALDLYDQSPPPGREADPYVVGAMADALAFLSRPAAAAEPIDPVLVTAGDLRHLMRLWQMWLRLAELDAGGAPQPPSRVMALWAAASIDVDALADRGFIVHRPAGDQGGGWLFHLGSWPLASAAMEDVVNPGPAQSGPVALYFGVWGPSGAFTLSLRGRLTDQGLVVGECSRRPLFNALLASLTDRDLAAGHVTSRDEAEREAIGRLAERLGKAGALVSDGHRLLVSADVDQTDYAPHTSWLADLAGYVRYGQPVLASMPWPMR